MIEPPAALVCSALAQRGIRVVLSGGAVLSIYSENRYESYDLDFVIEGLARKTAAIMEELGFRRQVGRHWVHPRNRYWVDFLPGPVAVGDSVVREVAERTTPFGVLRLLAPTDCVMDRLLWYYHGGDPQALEQAVSVAERHPVDLDRIREWSKRERSEAKFREFERQLQEAGGSPCGSSRRPG